MGMDMGRPNLMTKKLNVFSDNALMLQAGARQQGSAHDADDRDAVGRWLNFKRRAAEQGWKQAAEARDQGSFDWTRNEPRAPSLKRLRAEISVRFAGRTLTLAAEPPHPRIDALPAPSEGRRAWPSLAWLGMAGFAPANLRPCAFPSSSARHRGCQFRAATTANGNMACAGWTSAAGAANAASKRTTEDMA